MTTIAQQNAVFEELKTLCINYKKDGDSRKTSEYLSKRLFSLETLWRDFEDRHKILMEMEEKNIPYFNDEVYEKSKNMFETTKKDILRRMLTLTDTAPPKTSLGFMPKNPTVDDTLDEKLAEMILNQEGNLKALDHAISKINLTMIIEKWELEDHLSTLKSKWEAVDKLHWKLENQIKENQDYYETYNNIELRYDDMKKQINNKIWSTTHYQNSSPKIDIPEFSGHYNQWISFKDLFTEAIHNNPTIPKALKMQHLKTKLKGEAERLVQHLSVSTDNYDACWEILQQRYSNRRLQFSSFMNTMLNIQPIQQSNAFNLKKMHDIIDECLNGLQNIGVETKYWDPMVVHLMSQKLDQATYNEYIKELQNPRDLPNLQEFMNFLENKFMAYETMKSRPTTSNQNSTQKSVPQKKTFNFTFKKQDSKTYHASYGKCPCCDGNHTLMKCQQFGQMDKAQRNSLVFKLHLCKNCLYSHGNDECKSKKTCKECNMNHHTLLHYSNKKTMPTTPNTNSNITQKSTTPTNHQASSNHLFADETEILLTTVQLQVQSANGSYVTLRALLDQGSQVNLIAENTAQLLRLPRKKLNATISGIGAVSGDCKGRVNLLCKSIYSNYKLETEALVLKRLTNNLPNSTFKKYDWPHIENLKLADPEFNISRPVDLLLGADVYSQIILDGVLRGNLESPIAQQTQLGWILCGKLKTFNCHVSLININELTKYWEIEDIMKNEEISSDNYCEQYYTETVKRASDGKYIVKMPTTSDLREKLGKSKSIAVSQFFQLEKRLDRNKNFAIMYKDFINEYISLQHMKPADPAFNTPLHCYLPHHGVLRDSSTTTKLRVVYNASQKTSSGCSLNNLLQKGPNLQKDLQSLILKWRVYKFAFTADIEKMYRCIWLSEEQQPLQKIIWRNSPIEPLQEFQLCTVTYGTKCAPWLAMRTLYQLALDDGDKYPEAANILKNEFYVDDLVSGHHSLEEAKQLQQSLINLLRGGGMNLRKWSANNPALYENLTKNQISTQNEFDFKHEEAMKTLGLGWSPSKDTFTFNWDIQEKITTTLTKRHLLSEISSLFDPLGWLSPITVTAKLIFQKVWVQKLGWDEMLPQDIQNEWLKIRAELHNVKNIKISRWIGYTQQNIELLCYCDASEKAFAGVVYSCVKSEDGKSSITLLASKTKVAPLSQKTTLPRLELCGAVLLSSLVEKIKEALSDYCITTKAWCDSQVVLAWIKGDTSKWDIYVANRVTKIKQTIPANNWQYVKSENNPADCATRGLLPSKLINYDLWWKGPSYPTTNEFPIQENFEDLICLSTTNLDDKIKNTPQDNNFINSLLLKHSTFIRITRITAWIVRFTSNALNKTKPETNYLSVGELDTANEHIIKYVQVHEFEHEYKQLRKQDCLSKNSSIYKLNPYLDDKGILRVGGRLQNSDLPMGMKNPIILPKHGNLTKLIINQAHIQTLHGGARLTLAHIRRRYWIISGNRTVKAELRRCVRCIRYGPSRNNQIMGELPQPRVTPSRPFTFTGVDFTGHVDIKLNKGRGVKTSKGYIALFVCMATKAVHIELVSDLSTEMFIAALQRMCARRGTPKRMYSDFGTNFRGASNMLHNEFKEFKTMMSPDFFNELSKLEVEWSFNCPAFPSGGGIWESNIKSMKHHLKRVLGDQKLTYEEFSTLLSKIEACMNSRPLCPLTEDPDEFYNYLTPGHFLTGSPTMSLPLSDYSDIRTIDIRRRWQLTEHMLQQFWRRWSCDYLFQLQIRSKWNKPINNIQLDEVVLVKEDNLPPGKWALARVIETHPGKDGYVRVVTLKTQNGTTKRPVLKLAPLPVKSEENYPTKKEKTKSSKTLTQSLITMFTIFLSLFTLVTASSDGGVKFTTHFTAIETNRPIYYDTIGKMKTIHDQWSLIMYYNLTDYWGGIQKLETYLSYVRNFCHKSDPRFCRPTLEQLYHELDTFKYYNEILLAPHKHFNTRRRRGLIDGVGYVANSLFGVLDQRFAEKYQEDIKQIQKNDNYLLELIQNQTLIVELQNGNLKKYEENMKKQFILVDSLCKHTHQNLARVESEIEVIKATSLFNSASMATYLLFNTLKRIQEMLYDALTDVYKGHINLHLITPASFVQELNKIYGKLPKSLSLPVENLQEDIKDLYKLLQVKARVTDTYFLFEIRIPLVSNEDFTLHKVIPLPLRRETGTLTTFRLSSNYLAINLKQNKYISVREENLLLCLKQKPDIFLCNTNLPVYSLQSANAPCEAKILSHQGPSQCDMIKTTTCKDAWIELQAQNSWLFLCCESCTVRTVCENEVTSHSISSSNIINLAQGCVLQSNDMTIYAHNEYNSKMKMNLSIETLTPNSSVNSIVNLLNYSFPVYKQDIDFEKIEEKLAFQKNQEKHFSSELSVHDIHQYSVIYTILILVRIAFIIWALRRRYSSFWKKEEVKPARRPHYEDIEMQTLPRTKSVRHERGHERRSTCASRAAAPSPGSAVSPARPATADTISPANIVFHFD